MIVRLGYVAMSKELVGASPSQTMTYKQYQQIADEEAARRKLERIAKKNIQNCIRLLRHNAANGIHFFRLSSRLVPLANHPSLPDWNYLQPIKEDLQELGDLSREHNMRIDFHPDHFIVFTTSDKDIFKSSAESLTMHKKLLQAMEISLDHRCVLHVGGSYADKEKTLERYIHNFGLLPRDLQRMIMLENDDTTYNVEDALYLCEKLGLPLVFDLHHHMVYHENEDWFQHWNRIVDTWKFSELPLKIHMSSPRSEKDPRAHADLVDAEVFWAFIQKVKGSVNQIDCMIEAKDKDLALFALCDELKKKEGIDWVTPAIFQIG